MISLIATLKVREGRMEEAVEVFTKNIRIRKH